ncbi:MAG TPA: protein phosphatase 2C domain-containing protein [Polyangiaceae bacterium]|nr:protein phosphatase 2C domain-containing protein [Polyangiaceae bacterium]
MSAAKDPSARPQAALTLKAAGRTDLGKKRKHNEDVVLVREDLGLFVVADGAGGHNAGEVASALAARSMENYFGATIRATHELPELNRFGMPNGARRLSSAVHKANRDVVEIARSSPKHRGMGTTVVACCFSPRSGLMHVAHVGDSRCYRMRDGDFELLTQDHSLLTDVIEQRPELDEDMLARLPKNIVTRAIGLDGQLRVSIRSFSVVEGDRYLLCSDGLSGPVPATELAEVLGSQDEPALVTNRLIDLANAKGGPDNIAALIIDCQGGHRSALPADSVPPPPPELLAEPGSTSEPELLILGIQDLDVADAVSASDDLLKAIEEMLGQR